MPYAHAANRSSDVQQEPEAVRSTRIDAVRSNPLHNATSSPQESSLSHSSQMSPASGSYSSSSTSTVGHNPADAVENAHQAPIKPVGYLTSRRSAPSLRVDGPIDLSSSHTRVNHELSRPMKRASSFIRLALTSEGNATITTKDASSPSPPRAPQGALMIERPSNAVSDDANASSAATATSNPKPLHRTSSGRSRDSRAWEFWCDKNTRSELEDKAEKDASGSATGAIGLLRSSSRRRVLGSIPSKRNSAISSHASISKRSKLDQAPRQLQRSSTSLGRLQGKHAVTDREFLKPAPKLKHFKSATSAYVPGNDSDKENWSPELETHGERRGQQVHTHSLASAITAHPPKVRRQSNRGEAGSKSSAAHQAIKLEDDPEVVSFMRTGKGSSRVAADQELDCVQGLLSLSQGNWR